MKVEIDKDILLKFCASHSKLAQAEYDRNPQYNDSHFSAVAENSMINELKRLDLLDELFDVMRKDER